MRALGLETSPGVRAAPALAPPPPRPIAPARPQLAAAPAMAPRLPPPPAAITPEPMATPQKETERGVAATAAPTAAAAPRQPFPAAEPAAAEAPPQPTAAEMSVERESVSERAAVEPAAAEMGVAEAVGVGGGVGGVSGGLMGAIKHEMRGMMQRPEAAAAGAPAGEGVGGAMKGGGAVMRSDDEDVFCRCQQWGERGDGGVGGCVWVQPGLAACWAVAAIASLMTKIHQTNQPNQTTIQPNHSKPNQSNRDPWAAARPWQAAQPPPPPQRPLRLWSAAQGRLVRSSRRCPTQPTTHPCRLRSQAREGGQGLRVGVISGDDRDEGRWVVSVVAVGKAGEGGWSGWPAMRIKHAIELRKIATSLTSYVVCFDVRDW